MKYSHLEDQQGKSKGEASSSVLYSGQIPSRRRASATENGSTELGKSEPGTEEVVIISWEGAFMVQRKRALASQADS